MKLDLTKDRTANYWEEWKEIDQWINELLRQEMQANQLKSQHDEKKMICAKLQTDYQTNEEKNALARNDS